MGEKNKRTKEQEEEQKVTELWISSNEFDSTITWTECDIKTDTDRQRSRVREIEKQTHAQRNMEMEKKERDGERQFGGKRRFEFTNVDQLLDERIDI